MKQVAKSLGDRTGTVQRIVNDRGADASQRPSGAWGHPPRACPGGATPGRGDFRKVRITQSPIPESLHFFGSGLMGKQPLGDVALFLFTSCRVQIGGSLLRCDVGFLSGALPRLLLESMLSDEIVVCLRLAALFDQPFVGFVMFAE